jgi:hypothetical protein
MTQQQAPNTRPDAVEFSGTPLREFNGTFRDCVFKSEYDNQNGYLQFTDLEVLETKQAYGFPTAELKIKFNVKDRSSWGILMASVTRMGYEDLLDMKEHSLHMKAKDRTVVKTNDDTGDTETINWLEWEIVGIDGGANAAVAASSNAVTMDEHLLELVNGKTQGEFANAAMQDTGIRGNQALQAEVFDGALLPRLIEEGKITLGEDERYHIVGSSDGLPF